MSPRDRGLWPSGKNLKAGKPTGGGTGGGFGGIGEIPGESLDDKHKDWIEILDYNHD